MSVARIDYYLFWVLAKGALIVLLPLLMLETFVSFTDEVRHLDEGQTISQLVGLSIHRLPIVIYNFLPIAVFIGGLLGCGNLSACGEVTAALASGYSRCRLGVSIIATGMFFAMLTFAIGEWLVPMQEKTVAIMQSPQVDSRWHSDSPFAEKWMRVGQQYIHADRIDDQGVYHDLHIYRLNENDRLVQIIQASRMRISGEEYLAEEATQVHIDDDGLVFSVAPTLRIAALPAAGDVLMGGAMPPQWMNIWQLWHYVQFLQDSGLRHDLHRLAVWSHVTHPLTIPALLFLLLPFVFIGHAHKGQSLFIGVTVGIVYSIVVRGFSSVALAYHWPAWSGAWLPLLLVIATAALLLLLMRRGLFGVHHQASA